MKQIKLPIRGVSSLKTVGQFMRQEWSPPWTEEIRFIHLLEQFELVTAYGIERHPKLEMDFFTLTLFMDDQTLVLLRLTGISEEQSKSICEACGKSI